MPNKITNLSTKNENLKPFAQEANMFTEIDEVIDRYSGKISTVAAIGVVELIKQYLLTSIRETETE